MGAARVECGGACECSPFELDAYITSHASVPALSAFIMTANLEGGSGGEGRGACQVKVRSAHLSLPFTVPCVFSSLHHPLRVFSPHTLFQVTLLDRSSSPDGGHKFKVIGLTTSAQNIWHLEQTYKSLVSSEG
jgi:hypothetical protein